MNSLSRLMEGRSDLDSIFYAGKSPICSIFAHAYRELTSVLTEYLICHISAIMHASRLLQ